ncbi:uncharacterized protein LOC128992676 [Macrosteles quadrilineatus]|uniref:uncharacterized protein LOC128992676 n=1 Tax=Macrosteles quadrilineatus TaxID=74068 RepID=UPI0023E2E520|nr:uncharacterized protein LOC128992676 [Macrosteles quadrilineatus]
MKPTVLLLVVTYCTSVFSFSSDEKFIKKYAMMKVYESCFGPDVVKEVRKEMKVATAKCTGLSTTPLKIQHFDPPQHHNLVKTQPGNSQVHNIALSATKPPATPAPPPASESATPGFDLNKLQQVIMSGYNKHAQHTTYQQQPQPSQQSQFTPNHNPYLHAGLTNSVYQPPAYNPYYPPPGGYYPPPAPYYHSPFYPPYYRGQRTSRDFDIRGQLDSLAAKMTGKVRNVTCVMQELGYLDENLEPAYDKMIDRISRLPIAEDLKRDMTDGVNFCRQFAQCVPDERKDKLAREMVRPIFFFRCYKHKKLEACIMKDVRDKYNPGEDIGEDNLPGGEMRSLKNKKRKNLEDDDATAAAALELLEAERSFNLDDIL